MYTPLGTERIETERLVLRRFKKEDAVEMYNNWASDKEVTKYLKWDAHENIDITKCVIASWLEDYKNNNRYKWAIELKETGQIIGSASAVHFSVKDLNCEIGYCLSKKYWSAGITTEVLKTLIVFFFTEVGLVRIQARHDMENIASGKVMLKSGMKLEGTMRKAVLRKDGTFGDMNLWAIIKDDYFL